MALTNSQEKVKNLFSTFMQDQAANYMVIEGPPGVGKSYLTKELLDTVANERRLIALLMGVPPEDFDVHVTATTNKAAKVIGSAVGREPKTIYSLLGVSPKVNYKTGDTYLHQKRNHILPSNSLVVVDEAGYMDENLIQYIHKACKNCKVLLIGDPDQLTSVGLDDCPAFNLPYPNVYHGKLTDQVRSPGPIAQLAAGFRGVLHGGDWPKIVPDGKTIFHLDGPNFKKAIDKVYSDTYLLNQLFLEGDEENVRILAWSNSKVVEYNSYIRELLGLPIGLAKGDIVSSNNCMPNYKISVDQHLRIKSVGVETTRLNVVGNMVNTNKGSIFVPSTPSDAQKKLKSLARAKNWRDYYTVKETWGDFRPLFSNTVHKAQGSTYGVTFINLNDIGNNTNPRELARLMNVATSRASKKVVFYGELPKRFRGV